MALRVISERIMAAGKERNVTSLLRKMQQAAVVAPGYVSSEAFKDNANDQKLLVISSWHSEADWKAWQASKERVEVDAQLKEYVAGPTEHRLLSLYKSPDTFLL